MSKDFKLKNKTKFNRLINLDNIDINNISPIQYFTLSDVININNSLKDSSIFNGGKKKITKQESYNSKAVNKQVITRLSNRNFFEDITSKKQSPNSLIKKVIKYNKDNNIVTNVSNSNYMNLDSLTKAVKATENVLNNGGLITVFDFETIAGINQYGHNTLSNITEIAAIQYNVNNKLAKENKVINTVLGFTKKEANDARKKLNEIMSKDFSSWTNEEQVFFDRLNIYGNSKTIQDGLDIKVVKSKSINDIKKSKEFASKGIDLLEEVAIKQQALLPNNLSYEDYRNNILKDLRKLLESSDVIQGHNIVNYDINQLYKSLGNNKPINVPILDTLQASNYAINSFGVNSIYAKNAIRKDYKTGRATQETLAEAHNLKDKSLAAHIAINDTRENAGFIFGNIDGGNTYGKEINISDNSYFNKVIKKNIEKFNNNLKDTSTVYEDSNQLFYMDYTIQKSFNTENGALSFEYDPLTKSFKTFDGHVINNKNVSNQGYNVYGPKKGAVYQHNIYELEVNDDFKKQFINITNATPDQANKIFQEYSNASNLYIVESRQFMDMKSLEKKLGSKELAEYYFNNRPITYTIETNYERLGANLGVNIGRVDNNNNLIANEKAIRGLNIKNTWFDNEGVLVEDNKVVKPQILLDKLVDKSYDRTINDSASRKLRELDYIQLTQIRNYQKELNLKNNTNINNPIIKRISEMISNNEAIDLTKSEEICNALGWFDWSTNSSKIVKERLNNSLALESHLDSLSPLLSSIEEVLDDKFGKLDISNPKALNEVLKDPAKREILWKKNLIFKQAFNQYLDSIVDNPKILNNWKLTYHTEKELNKLDFNTFELFPNKIGTTLNNDKRNFTNKITSIDLNNPNSLFETFYKERFGDLDRRGLVTRNGNAGFETMKDIIEAINSDKRFYSKTNGPLLKDFNVEDYRKKGIQALKDDVNDKLISFVNSKRKKDSSFGYLNPRMNQDILSPANIKNYLKSIDKTALKENINNIIDDINIDFKIIGNHSRDEAINELVNNYFLDFKFNDLDLKGLTKEQISFNKKQYNLARKAAENKASSLLKAIENTNIQLAFNKENKTLSLIEDNNITELNIFKFNHRKGMMTYQIGDNEYALKMGLKYKDKSLSLSNTVDKIVERNYDHKSAEWAEKRGDSIVDAIIYNNSKTNKLLRDSSSLISIDNGQLFAQGFHFDANSLIEILPDLEENNVLEKLEAKYNIDDKARKSIRNIIDRVKNNEKYFKNKAFTKILPVELNFFGDNYLNPLLDELTQENGLLNTDAFTIDDKNILKGVGALSKNTAITKGNLSGVENAYIDPLAKLDSEMRPVMTQMSNNRLYNKTDVLLNTTMLKEDKDLNKSYKYLSPTSVYTSDNMDKFMYENISNAGDISTAGLSMKYLQIDSQSLKNKVLSEDSLNSINNFLDKNVAEADLDNAKALITDRLKRLSTYESESLMDARVHDIAFHKSNTQTINAKRRFIEEYSNNLDLIAYTKEPNKLYFKILEDGTIEYELGVKVKKGDILGRFGNDDFSQIIRARETGIFRGRFFDSHDNVVSETDLELALKDVDINNKKAVLDKLNSKYTFKYEVLGLEEAHGSKVILGASEKTTVDSMKLKVGEVDKELKNFLIANDMSDIVNKVVKKDYLDEVVYSELEDKLGVSKAQEVMDRILKERYLFSDAIHNIKDLEDVNFITNLNYNKHGAATALMHKGLNDLRNNNNLTAENLDKVFGKNNYEIIDRDGTKTVKIKPSLSEVNLVFDKDKDPILYKAFNTTDFIYDDKNNKIGYTGIGHIIQVYDDPSGTYSKVLDNEIIGKGVKFSEPMGKNLDRQTYNLDSLKNVYKHYQELGDIEEFKTIFGHALDLDKLENNELVLNDRYVGKSIATPITDRLRSKLYKSDYEPTVLDEINNPRYNYLIKSMNKEMLDDISVNKAETMYSYIKGNQALQVNLKDKDNVEGLVEKLITKEDFKLLDWTGDNPDFLEFAIGKQGKTIVNSELNSYTNNLIIKTGLGGKHEYLAIPRMPEKHAGDTLIAEKNINNLRDFQEKFKGMLVGSNDADLVKSKIVEYTNTLQADISGKEGLINDITEFRMEQSFMGKASGIVNTAFDNNNKFLLGSKDINTLNNLNADIFKTIKFNNKTWNQHYVEGKVIDSFAMGEQQFRDMGYFNKDFMELTLGNLKDDIKSEFKELNIETDEDKMKHLLRTRGDSFITVRYPEIMQGSDKFSMGYLDDSLKYNEIKVIGATGMSAKLDFDGDTFNAARVATSNNLSKLHEATSKNIDLELKEFTNAFDSNIMTRAINDNAFWEREFQNFFTKDGIGLAGMQKGFNLEDIASSKLINGKAYIGSIDKSELELQDLFNKYQNVIIKQKEKGGLKDDELINAIHEVGGESDEAINDYVAAKSWSDRRDMITAKVYHNAIGESNVTNKKIKSVISGYLNPLDDDYEYKSNLLADFLYQAEEQAISSKSSVKGLVSDKAQQWNEPVSNLFNHKGNRQENLKAAETWLRNNLDNALIPKHYLATSSYFANKMYENFNVITFDDMDEVLNNSETKDKVYNMLFKDIITRIDETSKMKDAKGLYQSLKVATSSAGANSNLTKSLMFLEEQSSNLKTVSEVMDKAFNVNTHTLVSRNTMEESSEAFRESIEETINNAVDNSKVSTNAKIGSIIDGIGDFAKSVKGSKLAKGAIGIAAGIMVAGFVGGRPRPADVHAMEEAKDYEDGNMQVQLADNNIMMNNGQQGYIININAKTDKGRDNTALALQQAIASGGNANINISMNITDNYGNINDKDIEKAILGAL